MDKLRNIIKNCKSLIDMPYNQLNLDNYIEKVSNKLHIENISFINTSPKTPIKLMSGQDKNAGIICSVNKKSRKNIYLIGKGILFDAGGYNLKTQEDNDINTMKIDMAGMAIAFGTATYFKNNVIPYCPVATNFIHNNQIIPGDIIKIGNKNVEITNTDAEGRLILAEALSSLKQNSKDIVITIATLTGAVEEAIGTGATGIFTYNNKLAKQYLEASKEMRERAWRLPLWAYLQKEYFKKKIIRNSYGDTEVEELPGATMGALFIRQFIKYPNNWLHLDIGGSAFDEKKRKATGIPIKSLINFIERINKCR